MPESTSTSGAMQTGKVAGGFTPSVAAGIACIVPIIGGIIFLVIEKRNKFVRFWAMQALLLGAFAFMGSIVFSEAHRILDPIWVIGWLMAFFLGVLHWIFRLALFATYIISIVKAFSNQEWEIPWLGKISRQLLARMDHEDIPTA